MSIAALALTGCGGGGQGGSAERTAPPPDRLSVSLQGGAFETFRIDLDCAVVDRAACRDILETLGRTDEDETCVPTNDDGRRIRVTGTIDGTPVSAVLRRRTDCETRAYEAVLRVVQ